jgi:hypothetical protein
MADQFRHHLTSPNIWIRLLFMILFGIAYSIAEFVIVCIAIFQFFAALITGRVNESLLKLGNNLSVYVYQVFQFQTFNSETRPYPFSDWPDEAVADNAWLREPEADASCAERDPAAAAPGTTTSGEGTAGDPRSVEAESAQSDSSAAAPDASSDDAPSDQGIEGESNRGDDDRIR